MWLIKLPFRIIALPIMAIVAVFSIFYSLALNLSAMVVGLLYLVLGSCSVMLLFQQAWIYAALVFGFAVLVFLAVMFDELISLGLEALTGKLSHFWLSSFALQRVSDLICLENGLSVIAPKPYKERTKRTEYPRRVKNRDVLCEDIDLILQKKPESFDTFLHELQQLNYEIKYGKHISVRGKNQTRFIRLSSLEDGYTEADLRAHFLGQREHKPAAKQRVRTNARPFNLVIDIQSKLQSKGVGYQRWASVYNLKQMSKTLLFLRDHKIESMEQLDQMVMQQVVKRDALLTSIRQSEKRLVEIGTLKKHIINYSKTRSTYEEYRKAGYSKKFLEAHREEITLHKAAKAAFDELGVKKLPKVKKLSIEYAKVLTAKKQTYAEYRQVKNEAQELLIAQRNIASLYDAERKEEEQKRQKENQIH